MAEMQTSETVVTCMDCGAKCTYIDDEWQCPACTHAQPSAEQNLIEVIGRDLLGGAADDYDVARKLAEAIRELVDERIEAATGARP